MLFAKSLSKIFKKNGIVLIDSEGQKYIIGNPNLNKPLTLKLLKKDLNWKLVLNPDLHFPEAYMRGEIKIENGSLFDFLNIFLKILVEEKLILMDISVKKSCIPGDFLLIIIYPLNLKKILNIIMI